MARYPGVPRGANARSAAGYWAGMSKNDARHPPVGTPDGPPGHIDYAAEETSQTPDEIEHDGDMGVSSDRIGPVAGAPSGDGRGTIGQEPTYDDPAEAEHDLEQDRDPEPDRDSAND